MSANGTVSYQVTLVRMTSVIVKCIEVNEQDLSIAYAIDALTSSSYTYLMAPDQIRYTYLRTYGISNILLLCTPIYMYKIKIKSY